MHPGHLRRTLVGTTVPAANSTSCRKQAGRQIRSIMALRCLLRRISVHSPSGPLMGPMHGASPAMSAGAPRFLATQSERERLQKLILEQEEKYNRRYAAIMAHLDAVEKDYPRREREMKELIEMYRLRNERGARRAKIITMFGCAYASVLLASVLLYFGIEAQ